MMEKYMRYQGLLATTLCTCAMAMSVTPVFADMSNPYGWYVEGNVGGVDTSDFDFHFKHETYNLGGNINFGYKFMPFFGLEIGASRFSNINLKLDDFQRNILINDPNWNQNFNPNWNNNQNWNNNNNFNNNQNNNHDNSNTLARLEPWSLGVAARGILPIGCSGMELFARVGYQVIWIRTEIVNDLAADILGFHNRHHSQSGVWSGLGAQYYFYPDVAGVIQWQHFEGGHRTGTYDLFSIGVSYLVLS